MNLKDGGLPEWLKKAQKTKPSKFPGNGTIKYYNRFIEIEDYLNRVVHPFVNLGADAIDQGTLTDHGPEHIRTVILRAGELASAACDLTAYEVYLLLAAAHLHDVGNLFGRETHELNTDAVVKELGNLGSGNDTVELKAIREIAQAHGGYVQGDETKGKR